MLPEIAPPVIVNVPLPTHTPPPLLDDAVLPEIAPPVSVNVPLPTYTPPPLEALPPVMAPDSGMLLVSVRLPPPRTWMTRNRLAASIVWPFRSSVTAFVTVSVASKSVAVTSFVSVTVSPASSCACSELHGVPSTNRSSLFAASTAKAGLSLKKYAFSPSDAPVANVTGADAVGVVLVVTPMRAPDERPFTAIVRPELR